MLFKVQIMVKKKRFTYGKYIVRCHCIIDQSPSSTTGTVHITRLVANALGKTIQTSNAAKFR